MSNHVHFIADSYNGNLRNILGAFKSHTAKALMTAIKDNPQESRKELFLNQFSYFGKKSKNIENQFWKHDRHPFYLFSEEMIAQKVNYIHKNPVEAMIVENASEYIFSSAVDYEDKNGMVKISKY
jgi:REP element-mobilizing transposase RayT